MTRWLLLDGAGNRKHTSMIRDRIHDKQSCGCRVISRSSPSLNESHLAKEK